VANFNLVVLAGTVRDIHYYVDHGEATFDIEIRVQNKPDVFVKCCHLCNIEVTQLENHDVIAHGEINQDNEVMVTTLELV
jgi:hypothetical protein